MNRLFRRMWSVLGILTILVGSFNWSAPSQVVVAALPTVTLVGDLQTAAGCAGIWDPGCTESRLIYDETDDVWQATFNLPAGNYQYKVALNGGWDENYGANAKPGGENINLSLTEPKAVKFYFDNETHWITDNLNSVIASVPGNYQKAIGCPDNWQPNCLHSWLQDPDGNGIYTFQTLPIPAGDYEAKVTINEDWGENYGQGGVKDGSNIPFKVLAMGSTVQFSYDASTHLLSLQVTSPESKPDNNVEWDGLRHDSRDLLYRTPGGAVPAGTGVKIRFRTFHNDVTGVSLRVYDLNAGGQTILPMSVAASAVSCYQPGLEYKTCDFWETSLERSDPDNLWYRFIVTDGSKTDYYADNTSALDGGLGQTSDDPVDNSYALMFYDAAFQSPAWASNAVIYQIFPDRFRNGTPSNDPQNGMVRYNDPAIKLPWDTLPEGYCRNYADADTKCQARFAPYTGKEQPQGRDYFGGDLKGVLQQLDYLQALGVTEIYFNPIFAAKSNHRYDTSDYTIVDPNLGTQKDFDQLISGAKKRGIRVVLDGVFNHMSSDSPFFDRYHHYPSMGACESAATSWRTWFTFRPPTGNEPAVCVPSQGGGADTYYTGWFNFDSIPVLTKSDPGVKDYFVTSPNSITRLWLQRGAAGWRLDVMGDSSFPTGYWEDFRQVVKQQTSDAVIVGELWQKDSTLLRFLRGDRADTTMNYRLRDAVIGLLTPGAFDSKGFGDSGRKIKPSEFAARLLAIREDYPDAAYYSLMNLLDSHDTERLLWTLTPGAETLADKELNTANLAAGKQRMQLATLIQFTVPGAPTIYYGDEVGLTGDDDPDDRRTFPWKALEDPASTKIDWALLNHYKALSQARKAYAPLVQGDLRVLLADDNASTLAYGRKTNGGVALVALNLSSTAQTLTIPVVSYLPDGLTLTGVYGVGSSAGVTAVTTGGKIELNLQPMSGLLLSTGSVDLTEPQAPNGLAVTNEGSAQVSLGWNAVSGAVSYNVYRSPLRGGGFVKVNSSPLSATNYTDSGLTNAVKYYYTVTAVNAAGIESGLSNEVAAVPHLVIGWANLQWPFTLNHTVSAINHTENIYGQVWIGGATNQPGLAPTLRAQLGYGPQGTDPAADPHWIWIEASFNTDSGNNDEFVASLLPEQTGDFDYLYRYSTTNGAGWLYADRNGLVPSGTLPANPGKLKVLQSGDTTAPAVPTGLTVVSASPVEVTLSWDEVSGDSTLLGYEVLRSGTAGGQYALLGLVTGTTTFADTSVVQDNTYYYVIRSVDTSFNRSSSSAEVSATPTPRTVNLVFNVTVPASTDGAGQSVYIAGFLDRLVGNLPQWDPAGKVLTRVDATHWTVNLSGKEGTQIEYKYALGAWDYVEKGDACGELGNRQLTLSYGSSGTQVVNDTVLNWRNVAPCGN